MLRNRIAFRVDGNSEIGLGHLMRCISLSIMLKNDFESFFLVLETTFDVKKIIIPYGEVIELSFLNERAELSSFLKKTDIAVMDGYNFGEEYQQFIKSKVKALVMIDDLADRSLIADLIINHGSSSISEKYSALTNAKVLAGYNYLILRNEFLLAAANFKKKEKINSVFICFGGADSNNLTIKALEACFEVDFIKTIKIVIGAAYIHTEQLKQYASIKKIGKTINIINNANSLELIQLIEKSEICIVPSSTISLEVCCVKSGILTGISATNQQLLHDELIANNCAETIYDFNTASILDIVKKLQKFGSTEFINEMMYMQSKRIDGKSNFRLLTEIKNIASC